MVVRQAVPVRLETHGPIPAGLPEFVTARVTPLLKVVNDHVDAVRIVLTRTANPAIPDSATARVIVIIDGRIVLAQAAASTAQGAVEHAIARLRMRLERVARGLEVSPGEAQSL